MKKLFILLLVCVLLSGCTAQPAQTTPPPETAFPPETTVPAAEPDMPEMPEISGLEPGYYLVSSVGKDGDITFYSALDPENGYLQLNADGTGTFLFEGEKAPLTWEEDAVHWQGQTLMGAIMRYYDNELGREDTMVVLYFTDPVVSVCLRPIPEEAF